MKFYNRESELQLLHKIRNQSLSQSQMTVLTGRRRIGKTRLILENMSGIPFLYFFISRKEERLLCEEFIEQIQTILNIPIYGEIRQFKDLFDLLINHAAQIPITLVIDEFQEFFRINPSIYSDIQRIWDLNKDRTSMNLILSGSVYSLMQQIFENMKEPLFGRANERLFIKPFSVDTLSKILNDHAPGFSPRDLLTFYMLTGGVPRYVEIFADKQSLSHESMLNEIFRENSLFLQEGKHLLIEEFGKEYTVYFSILALIASSKTSRVEIQSVLQKDIGGYLDLLENEYKIIQRVQPIFSKPGSRMIKYYISDNFLAFWFRFIYKNLATVEMGNFDYLKKIIDRDFPAFSGPFLEKFFHEKLAATGHYSLIGRYWEKGNLNEIDIVAINEIEKSALIGEVKLNKKQISLEQLRVKSAHLIQKFAGYKIQYQAFSLEDIA
ncbi:MAG: ATP-binding protein [Bacteroidia bacterium]